MKELSMRLTRAISVNQFTRLRIAILPRLLCCSPIGRFNPTVVQARQIERVRRVTALAQRVQSYLEAGRLIEAGISIQELARVTVPYLMERCGQGDRSFGRVFTRFCVLAHEHKEERIANRLIRLLSLTADEVEARFARAPADVAERHITSYPSRLAVGEEIHGAR